jgi:hypothetical protein
MQNPGAILKRGRRELNHLIRLITGLPIIGPVVQDSGAYLRR